MRPSWMKFKEVLQADWCDKVEEAVKEISAEDGLIAGNRKDETIRKSTHKWIDIHANQDIAYPVKSLMEQANSAEFGFHATLLHELQYTVYKRGDFYSTHMDMFPIKSPDDPVFDRKLGCTVMLSDPKSFSGGELVIMGEEIPLERGSVVVFPSFVPHEVKPVKRGVRKVLVSWLEGTPWQ